MSASGQHGRMDDETLLAVAYRGRPTTIDDLTTLSHAPKEEVAAAVDRLLARGRLSGNRDRFDYPNPAIWAAESVAKRAGELRHTTHDLLGEIEQLVANLPRMIGHWSIGEISGEPMPAVMRHGPRAVEDVWFELGRRDTGILEAVLPDISRFLSSPEERVARFSEEFRSKDAVRVIIPRPSAEDPAMSQLLLAFTAAGMTYRFSEAPPSWFWVDGDQLAVPVERGERKPTSVLSVRSAAPTEYSFLGTVTHADAKGDHPRNRIAHGQHQPAHGSSAHRSSDESLRRLNSVRAGSSLVRGRRAPSLTVSLAPSVGALALTIRRCSTSPISRWAQQLAICPPATTMCVPSVSSGTAATRSSGPATIFLRAECSGGPAQRCTCQKCRFASAVACRCACDLAPWRSTLPAS